MSRTHAVCPQCGDLLGIYDEEHSSFTCEKCPKETEDIVTRLTHERDEFLQNRCDHSFSKWSQAISECGTLRARVAEQDVREKRAEEYAIKLFRERDSWQKRAEEAEQEVERLKIWMRDE